MSKRNYTYIKELLPMIEAMVAEGMSQREIAEHFGFKDKFVVKEALKRARRKAIAIPKARGRKPAKTLQEYKYENKRLKMESIATLRKSGFKTLLFPVDRAGTWRKILQLWGR